MHEPLSIGKTACGRFSDIGLVFAGKRRDFCRLLLQQCSLPGSVSNVHLY
jgi:hypothetical protein